MPNVALIEHRRLLLERLSADLFSSHQIAAKVCGFLQEQHLFNGQLWLNDSLENYVMEVLLRGEAGAPEIIDRVVGCHCRDPVIAPSSAAQ